MKKAYLMIGLLALCCMCFVSCGGSKSDSQEASETVSDDKGVLADLIDVYIDLSNPNRSLEFGTRNGETSFDFTLFLF